MRSKSVPVRTCHRALGRFGCALGRVRRVEPAAFTKVSTLGVEEQRVNVLVDFLSPPEQWAGLGDGFQVDTRITVFTQEDATIIPAGALFRRGETWNVSVVENGRAQSREINLLRRSGRLAAVKEGLATGEASSSIQAIRSVRGSGLVPNERGRRFWHSG